MRICFLIHAICPTHHNTGIKNFYVEQLEDSFCWMIRWEVFLKQLYKSFKFMIMKLYLRLSAKEKNRKCPAILNWIVMRI